MSGPLAIDAYSAPASGAASNVTIIKDSTARWLVIVALAFGVAYALIGERTNYDAARHAQMSADLANFETGQLRIEMARAGLHVQPKETHNAKSP